MKKTIGEDEHGLANGNPAREVPEKSETRVEKGPVDPQLQLPILPDHNSHSHSEATAVRAVVPFRPLGGGDPELEEYSRFYLWGSHGGDPDMPLESPVGLIARVFQKKGVISSRLRIGLLTLVVLNSARLGESLAMEIVENEGAGASELLGISKMLTPQDSVREFHSMSPDDICCMGQDLVGKAILGSDSKGFKKVTRELNEWLERGSLLCQETMTSKFGRRVEPINIEGPIACLMVAKDPRDTLLTCSSALKIHLSAEEDPKNPASLHRAIQADDYDEGVFGVECAIVSRTLKRLKPHKVVIPYDPQLLKALSNTHVQNAPAKLKAIRRIIKIITIMNNLPPLSQNEFWAGMFDVDPEKMGRWMPFKGLDPARKFLPNSGENDNERGELIATKFDYFIFWLLMDNLIPVEDEPLTQRQIQVFNAIRKLNLDRIRGQTFANGNFDMFIRENLPHFTKAFVDRETIREKVNAGGGERISRSTLHNELQDLLKRDFITRDYVKPKEWGYAVKIPSLGSRIRLPHPSEIGDPIYRKRPVQVIHPFSGNGLTI